MTFEMSDTVQVITIYHIDRVTGELIGSDEISIPPHTGLPASCTTVEPISTGRDHVAVFKKGVWSIVENHRGKTVYDVKTGVAVTIMDLGSLPDSVTLIAPTGEYMKWDGAAWMVDSDAEKQAAIREAAVTKNTQLNVATAAISPLQDAVDLNMATDAEISLLADWKKYRVSLSRIDINSAPNIVWPELPA